METPVVRECPQCHSQLEHSGAALWHDRCVQCGWEQWGVADPALPSRPPQEYSIHWSSPAGATTADIVALRQLIPGLDSVPLSELLTKARGLPCWPLGDARGIDIERLESEARDHGLTLVARDKASL